MSRAIETIKFAALLLLRRVRRRLGMPEKMDKAKLLASLSTEYTRLAAMLEQTDDAQLVEAGAQDDWSVKDILAHIAVWDRRGTNWIRVAAQGEIPEIPEPGVTWEDMDRLNEQTFLENQHRPPREVLAEFHQAHQQLLEQVQALSDEDLVKPLHFDWMRGGPLPLGDLVTWRYRHYKSHGKFIRDWLRKSKEGVNE